MTARAANKRETVSQPWAAGSTDGVFAPYSGPRENERPPFAVRGMRRHDLWAASQDSRE
jgi:hypothetical protein